MHNVQFTALCFVHQAHFFVVFAYFVNAFLYLNNKKIYNSNSPINQEIREDDARGWGDGACGEP
jgi:hypothetical protein